MAMQMQAMTRNCPFCKSEMRVVETTGDKQEEVGLVYLKVKCHRCMSIIEGTGHGNEDAIKNLDKKIKKRIGTNPKMWAINVKRGYRRRR